jgi:hypothetical protein
MWVHSSLQCWRIQNWTDLRGREVPNSVLLCWVRLENLVLVHGGRLLTMGAKLPFLAFHESPHLVLHCVAPWIAASFYLCYLYSGVWEMPQLSKLLVETWGCIIHYFLKLSDNVLQERGQGLSWQIVFWMARLTTSLEVWIPPFGNTRRRWKQREPSLSSNSVLSKSVTILIKQKRKR